MKPAKKKRRSKKQTPEPEERRMLCSDVAALIAPILEHMREEMDKWAPR